jgi:hypothetical protein
MSSGGPFKLIINDSSVDDLMMRSKNLLELIRKIEDTRAQKKKEDHLPKVIKIILTVTKKNSSNTWRL